LKAVVAKSATTPKKQCAKKCILLFRQTGIDKYDVSYGINLVTVATTKDYLEVHQSELTKLETR